MIPALWPHQVRGMNDIRAAVRAGRKRIVVTGPTGSGKTRIILEVIRAMLEHNAWNPTLPPSRAVVYTERRIVTDQIDNWMNQAAINHGVFAAGWKPDLAQDVQIASLWTVHSRYFRTATWEKMAADIVIVDERHQATGAVAQGILEDHLRRGATAEIGFTATPVGLGKQCDTLIVAGTKEELRASGILVPCVAYAPDEPDMTTAKRNDDGEFVVEDVIRRVLVSEEGDRRQRIVGRVIPHLRKYNPDLRPTVLFAPDVPGSRFFANVLTKKGIPAAHIDAETPMEERHEVFRKLATGEIKVVCNRFVLREGWDFPGIFHMILATAIGKLSTYIQMVGRELRSAPGKTRAVLQDHGGNVRRHIHPDTDIDWKLEDDDNSLRKKLEHERKMGRAKEPEPIVCPRCCAVRAFGPVCPQCGHKHKRSVHYVLQTDGELRRVEQNQPKHISEETEAKRKQQRAWDSSMVAAAKSGRTVKQAMGMYKGRTGHWPPFELTPMPKDHYDEQTRKWIKSVDWDRQVSSVYPWYSTWGRKRKGAKHVECPSRREDEAPTDNQGSGVYPQSAGSVWAFGTDE